MLLSDFPTEEFIETFKKKFTRFCQNAPVILSYKVTPTACFVQEMGTKEIKKFDFDFNRPVEETIYSIKEWLLKDKYPRMVEVVETSRDLTPEEVEDFIEQGVPSERAMMEKKVDSDVIEWRIEKAFITQDTVYIRNLKTDQYYQYKMSVPITVFLKRMREGKYNSFDAWIEFNEKATLVREETVKNGEAVFPSDDSESEDPPWHNRSLKTEAVKRPDQLSYPPRNNSYRKPYSSSDKKPSKKYKIKRDF